MKHLLYLALLLVALVAGCDSPSAQQPLPGQAKTIAVQLNGHRFLLEVADTVASRQRGLMFRRTVPQDGGMLFIFDQSDVLTFWMRNTYVPLDVLFLDDAHKILSIKQMQPLDETIVSSELPARYAIELNQGTAASLNLKIGDMIGF